MAWGRDSVCTWMLNNELICYRSVGVGVGRRLGSVEWCSIEVGCVAVGVDVLLEQNRAEQQLK